MEGGKGRGKGMVAWAARGRKGEEGGGGQRASTDSLDTGRREGWAPLAITRATDCRRERNRLLAVLTCVLGATRQPSPTALSLALPK